MASMKTLTFFVMVTLLLQYETCHAQKVAEADKVDDGQPNQEQLQQAASEEDFFQQEHLPKLSSEQLHSGQKTHGEDNETTETVEPIESTTKRPTITQKSFKNKNKLRNPSLQTTIKPTSKPTLSKKRKVLLPKRNISITFNNDESNEQQLDSTLTEPTASPIFSDDDRHEPVKIYTWDSPETQKLNANLGKWMQRYQMLNQQTQKNMIQRPTWRKLGHYCLVSSDCLSKCCVYNSKTNERTCQRMARLNHQCNDAELKGGLYSDYCPCRPKHGDYMTSCQRNTCQISRGYENFF